MSNGRADTAQRSDIWITVLVLGSLWGFTEVVLSGAISAAGLPYRSAILTGIGMGLMAVAFGAFKRPWMLVATAFVALLRRCYDRGAGSGWNRGPGRAQGAERELGPNSHRIWNGPSCSSRLPLYWRTGRTVPVPPQLSSSWGASSVHDRRGHTLGHHIGSAIPCWLLDW